MISILFSIKNRLSLFKRVLYHLARSRFNDQVEVIVADEGSTEDIAGELRLYSSKIFWKLIKMDVESIKKATGLTSHWNNPSISANLAFRHSTGDPVFTQGAEVIPYQNAYEQLLRDYTPGSLVFSTTYDVPRGAVLRLDESGTNIGDFYGQCLDFPLHSPAYPSDVHNYLSLTSRAVWERLGGVDERYWGGISGEDSDFIRRLRAAGFTTKISGAVSLHQSHGGKTCYYDPDPSQISLQDFQAACKINRKLYESWDGKLESGQSWEWGTLGVKEIISNG